VTSIFGQTDDSRVYDIDHMGIRRVFPWLLCESYDSFGNLIRYDYKAENADGLELLTSHHTDALEKSRTALVAGGAKYLKSIRYGNTTPNRSLADWQPEPYDGQWLFHVVLDYGDHSDESPSIEASRPWLARADRFSACNSGFEVRWLRLCRRILMFHHFPLKLSEQASLVGSVSLQYNESPTGSFLTTFTQRGHMHDAKTGDLKTQSMPPYGFEYSQSAAMPEAKVKSMDTDTIPNYQALMMTRGNG
jgi:hypothetical protein